MKRILPTIIAVVLLVNSSFAGPIHDAAKEGDIAGVQEALDDGARLFVAGGTPKGTALHHAVANGHLEIVELLLANGANIHAIGGSPRGSALYLAAYNGHVKIGELLIDNGAKLDDSHRGHKWSPLYAATDRGHSEMVELLIDKGANVNEPGYTKMPALHLAAWKGDHEMAALLIAKGADVNLLNRGYTPLDAASPHEDDSPEAKAAKQIAADLIREHGGRSGAKLSIHAATRAGNVEDIKRLLADGADVNAIENGLAPVHIAASGGNVEIAALLINGGANVKAMTMHGWTPLHYAVWNGNLKILELLIDSGAIARLQDANSMVSIPGGMVQGLFTPLELALRKEFTEIADLLRDNYGYTKGELDAMPRLGYRDDKISIERGIANREYEVLFSADLKTWEVLETITIESLEGGKHVRFFEDDTSGGQPMRFYQLRLAE